MIKGGEVHYQCQFLRTAAFMKNMQAGRITTSEFGTVANTGRGSDDDDQPCQIASAHIFRRIANMGSLQHIMTDNANVSIYPFGREHYCFTESPFVQVCRWNISDSFT